MRWPWSRHQEPTWPAKINGYSTRPKCGDCPSCGADQDRWCNSGCVLLDPMDYR